MSSVDRVQRTKGERQELAGDDAMPQLTARSERRLVLFATLQGAADPQLPTVQVGSWKDRSGQIAFELAIGGPFLPT